VNRGGSWVPRDSHTLRKEVVQKCFNQAQ
jgi:hypothetical protein